MKELDGIRKNLEKEEYELEQEYTRLTQGKVLELPEEFETILQELGIHAVYGIGMAEKKQSESRRKGRFGAKTSVFALWSFVIQTGIE